VNGEIVWHPMTPCLVTELYEYRGWLTFKIDTTWMQLHAIEWQTGRLFFFESD